MLVAQHEKQNANLYFCKVVDPRKSQWVMWDFYVGALIVYSIISTPYQIAFSATSLEIWVFDLVVDCFFLADLILQFNMGYYDDDEVFVSDHRKIAVRYVRGWFIIDF